MKEDDAIPTLTVTETILKNAPCIGKGGFANVHLLFHQKKPIAIKRAFDYEEAIADIRREKEIIDKVGGPHILMRISFVEAPPHAIAVEYAPNGDLATWLNQHDTMNWLKCGLSWSKGIAMGLACLHENGFIHCDLKCANVLVFSDQVAKIADFGLSLTKEEAEKNTLWIGSAAWSAPEVFNECALSEKSDVYSYGVLLWEMATLDTPWKNQKDDVIEFRVGQQGETLPIPNNIPNVVAYAMGQCFFFASSVRPHARQLVKWFDQGTPNERNHHAPSQ